MNKLAPGSLINLGESGHMWRVGACRGGFYYVKPFRCYRVASILLPVDETHQKIEAGEMRVVDASAYSRHEVSGRGWLNAQSKYDRVHARMHGGH